MVTNEDQEDGTPLRIRATPEGRRDPVVHVAIAFDENLAHVAHVVATSAGRNCSKPVVVHVLERGVTPESWDRFEQRVGGVVEIRRYPMDHGWGRVRLGSWVSVSTMDRLLLPELVREARVIYIDIDCVVVGDLAQLYELSTGPRGIAAKSSTRTGFRMMSEYALRTKRNVPRLLKLSGGDHRSFNAGVLLLDLETLRRTDFAELTRRVVSQTASNDQITIVAYARGQYHELPPPWNTWVGVDHDQPQVRPIGILHYVGSRKPWEVPSIPMLDEWRKYAEAGA